MKNLIYMVRIELLLRLKLASWKKKDAISCLPENFCFQPVQFTSGCRMTAQKVKILKNLKLKCREYYKMSL